MNYLNKIFSTGAVRQTPARVLNQIAALVRSDKPLSIIELGAGKGEITRVVLEKISTPEKYLAFEIDNTYSRELASRFPQLEVLQQDAFSFRNSLAGIRPNLIISSFPLSFYRKEKIEKLLEDIREALQPGGAFIIIFHAFWLLPHLRRKFPGSTIKVFSTLPPYFLLSFTSKA